MLKSVRFEKKTIALTCVLICVVAVFVLGFATPAWAAEFTVNSTTDAPDTDPGDGTCAAATGDCTLRAAIQETNYSSYDTIVLPAGDYTLTVEGKDEDDAATGDLDIVAGGLTIEGAGNKGTIVDGGGIDRVFDVRFDTWATLSGVSVTGGDPGSAAGGGVRIRGQLELYDSVITNNIAESGGGLDSSGGGDLYTENTTISDNEASDGHGGGLYNAGDQDDGYADVEHSTISNNRASEFGGGIYSTAYAWIWNATLSGNTADEVGGGIRNFRNYLGLDNVVLADNSAPEGANLANDGNNTEFWNSIVTSGSGGSDNCSGDSVTSYGNNLDSGASCGFKESSDLSDTDPLLGELRDNGGPTMTRAPSPDSPVVDAVRDGYCSRTDQRGATRPSDGNGDGEATCDIGPFEVGQPVAKEDVYETDEDKPLTVPAPGVLDNDTDAEGEPLTAEVADEPNRGTLDLREDGSFVYTPEKDYYGYDRFEYKAKDGTSSGSVARVEIIVNSIQDPPVATNDSYQTDEDAKLTVPTLIFEEEAIKQVPGVLENDFDSDNDSITAKLVEGPKKGTLTFNQNGSFEYTPDSDFNGPDAFTYQANDGTANSNIATASIVVKPISDAPSTTADTASTDEGKPVSVNVLANDTTVDGDALTITDYTQPGSGRVNCTVEGVCTYTPNAAFSGSDSFTYTVSGTPSGSSETVTVTVNAVNESPVVKDDSVTTEENTPVSVEVLANDSDPDGDDLSVTDSTQGSSGEVSCTTSGRCTYTPDADFKGDDSFEYTVSDGKGATAIATVKITVEATADTTPPDTTISSGPKGLTNSDSATLAFASSEQDSVFKCALDGASPEECTSPKTYTDLVDGEHTFRVAASDEAGNEDPEPAVRRWTVDTTAPAIESRSPEKDARGVAPGKSVTVTFSEALDPQTVKGTSFFLTRQGATAAVPATVSYEAATNKATLDPSSELASDASYTVTVKGDSAAGGGVKDKAGNALAGDETWSFTTVDATPPETSIESGPSGLTNKNSASFTFSSTEPGSFACSLDGAAYSACTSPKSYPDLQEGSHTFRVRATDQAGNTDATPAVRRWSVDTTSPKVDSITPAGGARGVARAANVEVAFSEPMDASTVNKTTVTLAKGTSGTPLSATVTYDAATNRATLDPSANLDYGEPYTARVKGGSGGDAGGVKDRAGNTLTADKEWLFTVEPDPVGAKPAISKITSSEIGFYLRYTLTGGNADEISAVPGFNLSSKDAVAVMGDWDGNGTKTPGIYSSSGRFSLWNDRSLDRAPDRNFNVLRPGSSTDTFSISDPPLVGDWNGDGKDTVGVREGATFYLRNQNTEGEPDLGFTFGRSNDKPVTGDWNGDGKDTVGIRREAQWILKNQNAGGEGDLSFGYGVATDTPVVGDWDADGDDTVGIVRDGRWIARNTNSSGYGDLIFNYGPAGARPLVW